MNPESPLDASHLAAINRVLDRVKRAKGLLEMCRECDMDSDEPMAVFDQQHAKVSKLKRVFFPDHP